MGLIFSVVVGVSCLAMSATALALTLSAPGRQNPSLADIEARNQAEEARRQAEQRAREAQELADKLRQEADEEREHARAQQEQADMAAAHAAEEAQRIRAQMEEAAVAAQHAQELANEASRAATEEAERLALEAQAERERSQTIRMDAEMAMAEVRIEAQRAQKAADEQRLQAEAGRARAEGVARAAAIEAQKAREAKEEAERRLREGIQPVVTPSTSEIAAAKERVQYSDDCFHFAIAGVSGSGKSSLVNAFRGLLGKDHGAAAVGVTETTMQMARYPDANHPFVWYDIPGAGTLACRDWQYFNDQGLYVFDCIIVLFDNRFTMTDVAILMNARRFNIPTYIVRSKADQHIRNVMTEMCYDSESRNGAEKERLYKAAREQFIESTKKSVKTNLEDANLPDQRVYIVSNLAMFALVQQKMPKKAIDEVELIQDLLNQAYSRRGARSNKLSPEGEGGARV